MIHMRSIMHASYFDAIEFNFQQSSFFFEFRISFFGEYDFHCQFSDSEKKQLTVKNIIDSKNFQLTVKISIDSKKYQLTVKKIIDSVKYQLWVKWNFSLSAIFLLSGRVIFWKKSRL